MLFKRFKKFILLLSAALILTLLGIPSLRAQMSSLADRYLADIDMSTTNTWPFSKENLWANTNLTAQYTFLLLTEMNAWFLTDNSETTSKLQGGLSSMINVPVTNQTTQNSLQQQLYNDYFAAEKATTTNLPYANDLTYGTLIGQPYFAKDPRNTAESTVNSAYNYLKNASGLNISHDIPGGGGWRGPPEAIQQYTNFYMTISAVQTFNAYVLSQLYADASNGSLFNKTQTDLINTASGSSWFSTVANENIGFVLRQILMFSSQTFVILTQMFNTQNQLLQSQAMTNTLLILLNQTAEQNIKMKATGALPNG